MIVEAIKLMITPYSIICWILKEKYVTRYKLPQRTCQTKKSTSPHILLAKVLLFYRYDFIYHSICFYYIDIWFSIASRKLKDHPLFLLIPKKSNSYKFIPLIIVFCSINIIWNLLLSSTSLRKFICDKLRRCTAAGKQLCSQYDVRLEK